MTLSFSSLVQLSAALIVLTSLASRSQSLAANNSKDQAHEFVEMFNGEDLAGWGGEGKTEVNGYLWQDGILQSTPKSRNLVTEKSYADYILEFEFQLTPGANNGLGIHYPGEGNPAYAGMELQILDGDHEKYKGKLKDYQHHGSLYALAPALRGHLKPTGEWNFQRVTVDGPHITVELNGTRILEANLEEINETHPKHEGAKRRKGKIAFCGHGDVIRVRNMRIAEPPHEDAIKAYCLDFNWAPTRRRGRPFASPGQWANADPAEHVAWYEAMGANVIQTFAVSTNGYAWYKDGFVPEQPGLKHDFLPEMVKLGHAKGMKVFGYFCAASNPRWAELQPEQSYGSPSTYHIPYTDDYLDYLSKSIYDAVKKTGMDGFMVDWLWMPRRQSTDGKWIESEKQLYKQLMGEDFPGEDKLTKEQDTAYSRKAIDRAWQAIKTSAKSADPDCIIWLTVNKMHHPHVVNSEMYQEVDWLMNEAGSVAAIQKAREMVGEHTRLITCLAVWNGMDASTVVPEAIEAGVGLYGFTTPMSKDGTVPLEKIFSKQVTELSGDEKNIAVLARAYRGKSEHAVWQDGAFVEPENPPPFRLTF